MFYDLNLGWQDPNTLTHRERLSMACKLNIDVFALTQEVFDNLNERDRYVTWSRHIRHSVHPK